MMPRLLLVLLVLCGAAVPLAAQAARIDSLLGASAWREAVVVLDAVIAERPSAADFARRGRAHRELNELAKSRADYDAAIRADSTFGPAYAGRAATRIRLSDGEGALADVARARDFGVNVPVLHLLEGLANGTLRRDVPAVAAFTRYVEAVPTDPAGWYYRGFTHGLAERHAEAIEDLTRAIARGYAGPEVHRYRGLSHAALGNAAAACADGREAAARGDLDAAARVAKQCS